MGGLTGAQQEALLGFLRTAARGEASAELLRRRLRDAGCSPWLVFKGLQGSRPSKAWISSIDLFGWLAAQPHSVPNLVIEDLDSVTAPFAHVGHELRYQDFLRMFLPRDDSRSDFTQERPSPRCDASQGIPPEAAHRLCELITSEIDVARHLRHHRKKLLELGVTTADAARFLDADADSGSYGMISASNVRQVLVDRHHVLDMQQCESLLRRINPSGACMVPVDELAKLFSDSSNLGSRAGGLPVVDDHDTYGGLNQRALSAAAPAGVPPMLRDPGSMPSRPSSPSPRWNGHAWDTPSPPAPAVPAVSWSSPLQSPAGGDRSWHTPSRTSPEPHRSFHESPPYYQNRDTQGWGEPSAFQEDRDAQLRGEPSPPAFQRSREAQSRAEPLSPAFQRNREAQPWGEPESPSAQWSREAQRWGESSSPTQYPERSQRQSHIYGDRGQDTWSARAGKDLKPFRSPDARSALVSTQASTADYMSPKSPRQFASPVHTYGTPRHNWRDLSIIDRPSSPLRFSSPTRALSPSRASPPPRASSPARAVSPSRIPSYLRASSPSRMSSPRRGASPLRATSVPLAGVSWKPSASAYAPRPETPRRVGGGYSYEAPIRPGSLIQAQRESRKQNVTAVLHTIAKQAELDAQLEEAKEMVSPNIGLESIFNLLDRFRKGYITDMDMWQFCQDFGAATPYGGFRSLAQDILLRIHKKSHALNHLSMRDLGTLIFPLHSQEHKEMCEADSDAEAMSILYLLRNSEACPGCGVRVQRDADAAGCPSVTCSRCGTSFRCFVVVSDYASPPSASGPLAASAQYHVYKFIDAAARAAKDLDAGRMHCASAPSYDAVSALSDVFAHIANGKLSFTMSDLRRALFAQDVFISEPQLGLLLRRYAPNGREVSFLDFAKQLKVS